MSVRIQDHLSFDIAVQVERVSADGTLLQCSGEPERVAEWWRKYKGSYPVEGYGTQIVSDRTVGGMRTIRTDRYRSCD